MISPRIYIIIPRTVTDNKGKNVTMTCGRMAAHAAHAAGILARDGVEVDELDLIVLSVPDSLHMVSIQLSLEESSVDFVEYRDRDKAFFGDLLTAIALFPIEKGSCQLLNSLKSWRCACNET